MKEIEEGLDHYNAEKGVNQHPVVIIIGIFMLIALVAIWAK